eukprot:scaffold35004_cov73-Skeletonema_marinoi.AAC.1
MERQFNTVVEEGVIVVIEEVASHQSRSITIAQAAPTTQKRRTIYFLQRYRRKESMDIKSNGLMVQQ